MFGKQMLLSAETPKKRVLNPSSNAAISYMHGKYFFFFPPSTNSILILTHSSPPSLSSARLILAFALSCFPLVFSFSGPSFLFYSLISI